MLYTDTLSQTQVQAYLNRLELTHPIEIDLDGLNALLFAQLTHIPFDSLDVWGAGICPSLGLEDIYNKIVIKGRGGYCFELNTLFRSLLNAMGFDAYQAIACILNPDGTPQPPAHNVILCNLQDKRYFLDVGYGGPVPYRALELKEGLQDGFLLEKREDFWYVTRTTQKETRPLICFRDIPVTVNDLIPLNFYISQRPDSHFRHMIHLSKRNADGSIYSLDGNEFKLHTTDGVTVRELTSIEEVKEIMLTYFDMDPETAPLRDTL
jgi:N-hydroxyarylamine O-acetyltransferase